MKDYKDMFGSDRDKRDTNTPFNSRKESTFDLFSINVSKAEKDIKDVFGFAHSQLTDFEKHSMRSTKEITNNYREEYKRLYSDLSSYHIDFLNDLIKREARAADEVRKIWSSVDRNGNNGGNSYTPSGNIFNNNNDNGSNGSSINIDTERISQSTEQAAEQISSSNEKTSKSFSVSATIIKGAAEVLLSGFTKFMDIWIDRFFDGMDRIVDTYEDTYQTVSATMHIDQNQYKQFQTTTLEEIKSLGMENNLAISTVMKELDSVVKLGVTGQEAYNKALADSITKVINPYLEVTSDAYTDLQTKFGTEFIVTMTGIAEATRQSAGSNRFMQRNINDILTSMEPIVLNAKSDYADRTLGPMVQKLEAAVANGTMTMADAENIKQNIVDLQLNPYNALTSDNLGVAMTAQTAASRNVDFKDSSAILDIYAEQMDNLTKDLSTNGTWNQINKGAVYSVYGFNTSMWNNEESFKKVISELDTISSYSSGISRISDFSKDQLNTAKQTKDIWAENQSLALAQFKQTYPDAYEILSTMAATLTKILFSIGGQALGNILSNAGSKILGKAFGGGATGGSGMSFGNIFGKAAGETAGKGILNGLGSKVTTGLANLGGGSVGAGVATVGGVTAGALLAAQGTYHVLDASKTLANSGETSSNKTAAGWQLGGGATAVAGGIGGATALIALGASNPVGWVALGIAALGVTVASVAKSMKKTPKVVDEMNESFTRVTDKANNETENNYNNIISDKNNAEAQIRSAIESTDRSVKENLLRQYNIDFTDGEVISSLNSKLNSLLSASENRTDTDIAVAKMDIESANIQQSENLFDSVNERNVPVYDKNASGSNASKLRDYFVSLVDSGEEDKAKQFLIDLGNSSEKADSAIAYTHSDYGKNHREDWGLEETTNLYDKYSTSDDINNLNNTISTINDKYDVGLKQIETVDEDKVSKAINAWNEYFRLFAEEYVYDKNGTGDISNAEKSQMQKDYELLTSIFGKSDIDSVKSALESDLDEGSFSPEEVLVVVNQLPLSDDDNLGDPDDYGNNLGTGQNYKSYAALDIFNSGDENYRKINDYNGYATGISYVPEDETANIHKGEAVLTTAEAREYRQAKATVQSLYDLSLPKISGNSDDNNNDISRSDMLTNINNNIAKIVEAILNLQKSSNSDNMPGPTNDNLLGKINTSYDGNLVGLRSTTTVRQR